MHCIIYCCSCGTFSSGEDSRDALDQLESLVAKLRGDLDARQTLLANVVKWQALTADFESVEAENRDPNRLTNRGARLLVLPQELTKISKNIAQYFDQLTKDVEQWETANGSKFEVEDERFLGVMKAFVETHSVSYFSPILRLLIPSRVILLYPCNMDTKMKYSRTSDNKVTR